MSNVPNKNITVYLDKTDIAITFYLVLCNVFLSVKRFQCEGNAELCKSKRT